MLPDIKFRLGPEKPDTVPYWGIQEEWFISKINMNFIETGKIAVITMNSKDLGIKSVTPALKGLGHENVQNLPRSETKYVKRNSIN